MKFGEWGAHFIDSASVLRKGGNADERGIRYQTMPLPGNVGAPLIVQDLEQLRFIFENEEPRLVEGLLAVIESFDLSLLQLSNEDGRRFNDFLRGFQDERQGMIRAEYEPGQPAPGHEEHFAKNKNFDGNKKY